MRGAQDPGQDLLLHPRVPGFADASPPRYHVALVAGTRGLGPNVAHGLLAICLHGFLQGLQGLQAWFQKFPGFAPFSHLEWSCSVSLAPVSGVRGLPVTLQIRDSGWFPTSHWALVGTCLCRPPARGATPQARSPTWSRDGPAGQSPQTYPCPCHSWSRGTEKGWRQDRQELQQ